MELIGGDVGRSVFTGAALLPKLKNRRLAGIFNSGVACDGKDPGVTVHCGLSQRRRRGGRLP